MAQVSSDPLVLLGVCLGAFGVRGELKVKSFTEAPEGVGAYGPLYAEDGALLLTPTRTRVLKPGLAAVTAREVASREQAEALRGRGLHAPRSALPASQDEDDVLIADLLGCAVVHRDGRALGTVVEVANFGAGDLLAIAHAGRRWWLPFTRENVPELAPGRLIVDPPAGLEPEEPET
jgi:16S rRNA processing protein RimM